MNKKNIESYLKTTFNVNEILWLERGLEGDHTDGHIDDVARFVDPRTIVICKTNDKKPHVNNSIMYVKPIIMYKKSKKEFVRFILKKGHTK